MLCPTSPPVTDIWAHCLAFPHHPYLPSFLAQASGHHKLVGLYRTVLFLVSNCCTLLWGLLFQEVALLSAVAQLVLQCGFLVVCDVNSTPLLAPEGIECFRAKRIWISVKQTFYCLLCMVLKHGLLVWVENINCNYLNIRYSRKYLDLRKMK
jgi:hypothetical protein